MAVRFRASAPSGFLSAASLRLFLGLALLLLASRTEAKPKLNWPNTGRGYRMCGCGSLMNLSLKP